MERPSFAASLRNVLNNVRAEQQARGVGGSDTGAVDALNILQTSQVARRPVLAALLGSALAGCASGEHNIDPNRYPPRTTAAETSAASTMTNQPATGQETSKPTNEATFSETESERCIREQATRMAQLALDASKDPPTSTWSTKEKYNDYAETYTAPITAGWNKETLEYSFYLSKATVNETTDSKGQPQPEITNGPWQASIGRYLGRQHPDVLLDNYELIYVGNDKGGWCLKSQRRVTKNKKTYLEEPFYYYTRPGEGKNAFDDNAKKDLSKIDILMERARMAINKPLEKPTYKDPPYPIPKFTPR